MKIVITGGGGFLGSRLCSALLQQGTLADATGQRQPITEIILLDTAFRAPESRPGVRQLQAEISDADTVKAAVVGDAPVSIFHLASMVSGECEERFDDAVRVNLDGGRTVFEAARAAGPSTRVIFASSIACYGGEAMQPVNDDRTKLTPRTTYGMTKVLCELLLNDYSRKGFFDGRTARLPTVIIRPGKPNAAASSWASGMFREPLSGVACELPVRRDQPHPMTGYRTVIESLIALHDVPTAKLSDDRAYVLPAHQVTPRIAEEVLHRVAAKRGVRLGAIEEVFNPRIQSIVDNWPVAVDGSRAIALGLPSPPSLDEIVEGYLDDFQPTPTGLSTR